ncbi:MAG: phage holin, LLH family [Acidobacteriaceae bacterium]
MSQETIWILSGITLVVGFLLRHFFGPELKKIEAAIPAADLSILKELAAIVVPLVERSLPLATGAEKMARAIDLVLGWLKARGINITITEIEAAIEKAYADFVTSGQQKVYVTAPVAKTTTGTKTSSTSPSKTS